MKIEGKKLLERLAKEQSDRTKVSLYLSKRLYDDFKKACGKVAASQVMEELMRQFLASLDGNK